MRRDVRDLSGEQRAESGEVQTSVKKKVTGKRGRVL